MAKKHIALVSVNNINPNLSDGGSRATYEVLRFLSHQGHPVSFLNFFSNKRYRFRDANPVAQTACSGNLLYGEKGRGISLVEQAVSFRSDKMQNRDALITHVAETLRGENVDFTITCDADYLSLLAVSILNLPGVHLFNSADNVQKYEIIHPAYACMLGKRSILTVSDFLRNKIGIALKIPADVWYNRVDFSVRGMSDHGMGAAVGFYSSGTTIKGEQIVEQLVKNMPHVPFVTIGRPLRPPGESEFGFANLCHLGWIELMSRFYDRLKVLVVPSLVEEGASRVIVEACSRGIPVIANRLGGMPEALGDSGILVDVDLACGPDIEGLAEIYKAHIEHLLGNREVFETYQKRALDRAEAYRQLQEINSREIYDKYFA